MTDPLRFLTDPRNRLEREARIRVHGLVNIVEGIDQLVRGERYTAWSLSLCAWEATRGITKRRAALQELTRLSEETPGGYR